MLAEDVAEYAPELTYKDEGELRGIHYKGFIPLLIKKCQEQQHGIDDLKSNVNILEYKTKLRELEMEELRKKINKLESLVNSML